MFVDQNEIRAHFSGHLLRRDQVAQAEQRQADGEHPVDAHHRRVAVVGGQRGADLVVGDDRQVDQEAEDAGAEEVPEADGDEEHDRPAVRERRLRASTPAPPRAAGSDHASTVRNVSGITSAAEKNAPSAMCSAGSPEKYRWCIVPMTPPNEYRMMSRKIDGQRDLLAHHAEQHEHVGDHHGGEELEEVLDPEVHDPEAPELRDREVRRRCARSARPRRTPGSPARRGRTATACCRGARPRAAGAGPARA